MALKSNTKQRFRVLLLIQLVALVATSQEESPTVRPSAPPQEDVVIPTRFGYVRGVRMATRSGRFVDHFRGIPFAEKPQRLKKSTLVRRWNSVLDARSYPPKCISSIRPDNETVHDFSEDCLYLNIVRPSGITNRDKLPVAIYIHGGGFYEGFGNDPPGETFAEHFAVSDVLVVSIQYRLAMLGFLSLGCGDTRVPCNLGLWDMLTAFRFTNATIRDFGGDPSNMTLWGHSAGAFAVSLHSMSPLSSKFFRKYIEMSGSGWSSSRFVAQNSEQSRRILRELRCNVTSADTIFECINRTSLDDMYTAQVNTILRPDFGDELLPNWPSELVREHSRNQKLLTGLMSLESLYFTYLKSSPQIFPFIDRRFVDDYINSTVAVGYGSADAMDAYTTASEYYLSAAANVSDDDFAYFMERRTKIDSNMGFDVPVLRETRAKSAAASSVFLYHFPYFNVAEFDIDFPVKATYHCHEFPFLWGVYKDNRYALDSNDRLVSRFFTQAVVNFIKFGDPSSSNFTWPKVDDEMTHTVIQPQPTTAKNLFKADYEFWDSMASKFQFDLITGLPVDAQFVTTTTGSSAGSAHFFALLTMILAGTFVRLTA